MIGVKHPLIGHEAVSSKYLRYKLLQTIISSLLPEVKFWVKFRVGPNKLVPLE